MTNDQAFGTSAVSLVILDDPEGEAPAVVGNKAATLAVMRRAGFEVPQGVVVSAARFGGFAAELPPAVSAALAKVPELLGRGPWAVRSSSTDEDGEEASFAGAFESFLNVDVDGLAGAVERCWRSGLTDRVKAYAGNRSAGSMAVLIQPMVDAEAAGVAFTVDPVSGRDVTIIEAVAGLGDRLVSGEATPERWTVEENGSIGVLPAAGVLDVEQALAIADLANRVEKHFGQPQDIEWAIAGGSLWILQARPITTLPTVELIPIPVEVPPGYWERDAFHEPVPISPFGRILLHEQILKVFPAVFPDFGILLDRAEVSFIGGWIYRRQVPMGEPPAGRGRSSPPPRWLSWLLIRLHPAIHRRTRAARRALAADLPATIIRRWSDEWRPTHQEEVVRGLAVDLISLSDEELAVQLDHRIEVVGHPAHVVVAVAYWILVYQLAEVCRDLMGWDTAETLTLLEGLSTISTEPARQLAQLAERARSKPVIRDLLSSVDEDTPARLAEVDPEFSRAFTEFVEANAHRSLRWEVIDPTFAETPHILLRLVADQIEAEFSPDQVAEEARRRRSRAVEEARRLLASLSEPDRERFEQALARAEEAYPALEDRTWWTLSVQAALLRYVAQEIGCRLVDRGQLSDVDDIFFLEASDARSALLDGADRRETARVAKGQRAWAMANPGPYAYGDPPPGEPPFDLLPPPARLVNKAVLWGTTQLFGEPPEAQDEGVVTGTPASPGRYTGTVRVVMGEDELAKVRAGDVVVCPVTSPAWSVVFPNMGALVTDAGGILSHPAIIAREHGIPAVVGTGNATSLLRDGQIVSVDGTQGAVELASG
ncbi:MAG TPA: PEP/pyruvate-binding domain-containing protein [Acidimicrobiia bacterium]